MFQKFYPSEDIRSTYDIDFERYYKEGYRGVIFDVDNTLVPHNAPADERAKKLFKRLDAMGMQYCFTSNNKEPRVKAFCEAVGGKYYVYKANKPSINFAFSCRNFICSVDTSNASSASVPCPTNKRFLRNHKKSVINCDHSLP